MQFQFIGISSLWQGFVVAVRLVHVGFAFTSRPRRRWPWENRNGPGAAALTCDKVRPGRIQFQADPQTWDWLHFEARPLRSPVAYHLWSISWSLNRPKEKSNDFFCEKLRFWQNFLLRFLVIKYTIFFMLILYQSYYWLNNLPNKLKN